VQTHQQQPDVTYEGRLLARPQEELTDQGLGFDVATMVSRRPVLRAFGLGAAALGLAACSSGATTSPTDVDGNRVCVCTSLSRD
jgi:hypothetical protein